MSFSLAAAGNPATVKEQIEMGATSQQAYGGYLLAKTKDVIFAVTEKLPENKTLIVEANGHCDSDGNANLTINLRTLHTWQRANG